MPYLTVRHPNGSSEDVELNREKDLTIGRSGSNTVYVPDDPKVSARHCRFYFDETRNGFVLSDLNSTNGCFLNSIKMVYDVLLADKDKAQLGDVVVTYHQEDFSLAATTATRKVPKQNPSADTDGECLDDTRVSLLKEKALEPLQKDDFSLAPGECLGAYRIQRKLAELRFSSVYSAVNFKVANAPLALRVFNFPFENGDPALEDFNECALRLKALDDPYFAHVYEHGVHLKHCFLTSTLLHADDLTTRLAKQGPFQELDALNIGYTVASALENALLSQGIVHGMLSPGCILLDDSENLTIKAYGLAPWIARRIAYGRLIALPAFASPEQALGKPFDWQSDAYALGIILFTLVAGSPPFCEASMKDTLEMQISKPLPKIEEINRAAQVSTPFKELLERMTAKKPEDRFPSWRAAIETMETVSMGGLDQKTAKEPELLTSGQYKIGIV